MYLILLNKDLCFDVEIHYNKRASSSICSNVSMCLITPNERVPPATLTGNLFFQMKYCKLKNQTDPVMEDHLVHEARWVARVGQQFGCSFEARRLGRLAHHEQEDEETRKSLPVPTHAQQPITVSPNGQMSTKTLMNGKSVKNNTGLLDWRRGNAEAATREEALVPLIETDRFQGTRRQHKRGDYLLVLVVSPLTMTNSRRWNSQLMMSRTWNGVFTVTTTYASEFILSAPYWNEIDNQLVWHHMTFIFSLIWNQYDTPNLHLLPLFQSD